MFTNQKFLGVVLVVFIIGTAIYLTFTKFKQEVSPSASPSPTPGPLTFVFQTSAPAPAAGQTQQPTPQPTELPLAHNKKLNGFPGIVTDETRQNKKAVFQTSKGTFEIEIYPEVPMASSNFLILAANGFYDGLTFHRVEAGFVVQGGDPNGDGTGGPGYTFPDEVVTRDYKKGIVAMANAGLNTNGSQFFILLADHPELPKKYTIFGNVISGMDVVESLSVGDVMQKVIIQNLQ